MLPFFCLSILIHFYFLKENLYKMTSDELFSFFFFGCCSFYNRHGISCLFFSRKKVLGPFVLIPMKWLLKFEVEEKSQAAELELRARRARAGFEKYNNDSTKKKDVCHTQENK
ncbi:hypothetical protein I3842_03G002300 [Carya illinoinensis]|uniref:Uncharacterized protein n=1 Tax=Carya illinoinensis TaxID=32201 RepID=A0A922FFX9_CARIL|nr:hypothetical protein I3842_03G002300 [Carya illinoinensis]